MTGCGGDGVELSVQLQTGLRPGRQFERIRTELTIDGVEHGSESAAVSATDSFVMAETIAELDGLDRGDAEVRVRLLDSGGGTVAERRTVFGLQEDRILLVRITYDCVDITCPGPDDPAGATACAGGLCVSPECDERDGGCATECTTDAMCSSEVECADVRCEAGLCVAVPRDEACAAGQWCDPSTGCRDGDGDGENADGGMPDAGPVDAGNRCGDGTCDSAAGEDTSSCPSDCGWTQIATGHEHSCGLKGDGTVWCWGRNQSGQIGDGTTQSRWTPVMIMGSVSSIAAAHRSTCAVTNGGAAWCWGENKWGQLGIGATSPDSCGGVDCATTPQQVSGLTDVEQITLEGAHTCVVLADDTVWCWGNNASGRLGDGTEVHRDQPVQVMTGARAVACGGANTCAIANDQSLWCWGLNERGQLGIGTNVGPETCSGFACATTPQHVSSLSSAHAVDGGGSFSCALSASSLSCWGVNERDARLGDGTLIDRHAPTLIIGNVGVFSNGVSHSCAIESGGASWCWGRNAEGQLGVGTAAGPETCGSDSCSKSPVQVSNISNFTQISCGKTHTCALISDRTAWCWGDNDYGQLGDGTTQARLVPNPVTDPY